MNTYPKISIITPSYNQGAFIEQTILSILEQNYPNLEYIIIDGGSTDNTVEIIKKYEKHLTHWVSEKDSGQSEAINKGFAKATGDVINWINSDDHYVPGALQKVRKGDPINWKADISRLQSLGYTQGFDLRAGLNEYAKWLKEKE